MNFQKLVNSKLNVIADWIIRVVMINVMIITFSLPVITIFPAISSGYNMFLDYLSNKEVHLFKDYWKYFRESIGRKILFGIFILIVFFLGFSNINYYTRVLQNSVTIFDQVGYYVSMAMLAVAYAITLYTPAVIKVYPKIGFINFFRVAFVLAGKFYLTTMLLVLANSVPLLLLLVPQLAVVFIFGAISLALILNVTLTRKAIIYLQELGDQNG